ncbi:hypothetical protein L6164_031847 [Bauhinia variegata]|uniref:Uncharacterized protein n=1 Tax=Bauhinia variegata TaxID=167791 RepID=A0ACB9KLQ9_BAUVA|nr:hypothetical protein L6164_031847 [Bauhinia variegata]
MKQLIGSLVDFTVTRNYYEDVEKFVLCVTVDYGKAARIATSFVILGLVSVCIYAMRKRALKKRRVLTRSKSFAELHGGDLALQRFDDFIQACGNHGALNKAEDLLKALLEEEYLDLKKLQSVVAKLEMGGREAIAVDILKKAVSRHAKKPQEAYEIEMLLVEMLIYKGDYQVAMKCKCLNEEFIAADARPSMFKAVLHLMLKKEDDNKAAEYWDEYIYIRRQFVDIKASYQTEGMNKFLTDFEEFKKKVKDLGRAIKKVKAKEQNPWI